MQKEFLFVGDSEDDSLGTKELIEKLVVFFTQPDAQVSMVDRVHSNPFVAGNISVAPRDHHGEGGPKVFLLEELMMGKFRKYEFISWDMQGFSPIIMWPFFLKMFCTVGSQSSSFAEGAEPAVTAEEVSEVPHPLPSSVFSDFHRWNVWDLLEAFWICLRRKSIVGASGNFRCQ